jgi:hypothetical protein
MSEDRHDLFVEVIIHRVHVFGDDFVELCVAAGLDFVDVVGFFADKPHRADEVDSSALEVAGVSPAVGVALCNDPDGLTKASGQRFR